MFTCTLRRMAQAFLRREEIAWCVCLPWCGGAGPFLHNHTLSSLWWQLPPPPAPPPPPPPLTAGPSLLHLLLSGSVRTFSQMIRTIMESRHAAGLAVFIWAQQVSDWTSFKPSVSTFTIKLPLFLNSQHKEFFHRFFCVMSSYAVWLFPSFDITGLLCFFQHNIFFK